MTVVVCHCWYNGLNIIQSLGRKGIDVHAVDSFRNVGTTSRYATYHQVPNPSAENIDATVSSLLDLASRHEGKPVLIPTSDTWVMALAQNYQSLSEQYQLCFSREEIVRRLINKDRFGRWAQKRGYPVPKTWADSAKIPDSAFPIVAKPTDPRDRQTSGSSSLFVRTLNRITRKERTSNTTQCSDTSVQEDNSVLRVKILTDRTDLKQYEKNHRSNLNQVVFQEYVRGISDAMYTVGLYANKGEVKGIFTGRKVRGYPPEHGDCKVGQAQSVPDDIIKTVKTICADLEYTGIAEFEFKRDEVSGEYYLLEINPRSWSWVGITPAAGVNIPWIAYADQYGLEYTEQKEPLDWDGQIKWVQTLEDLFNCLALYRSSHKPWHMRPREWWQSLSCDTLILSDLCRDDPVPSIVSIGLLFRRIAIESKNQLKS